jgi:hypothetical protein
MSYDYVKTRENLYGTDPDTIARNTPIYGHTGRFAVLEGEEKATYAERGQQFIREHEPKGILEEQLVQMIHDNAWRINRAAAEEQRIWAATDNGKDGDGRALTKLNSYSAARERTMFRAVSELRKIQAERRAKEAAANKAAEGDKPKKAKDEKGKTSPPVQNGFVPSECETWLMFERFLHPNHPHS